MFYAPSAGYKGRRPKKPPRAPVAGPYRSQSSVPSIRKSATRHEHRKVAPSTNLAEALRGASNPLLTPGYSGPAQLPSLLGLTKAQQDTLQRQGIKASALNALLKGREDEQHAPSTLEDLGVAAALSPVGPEALIAKLGASGLERLIPGAAKAIKASEDLASESGAAKAASGGLRGVARRAAVKAEPDAVAAARQGIARKAAQTVEKLPKPVQVAGKVAGRAVTAPIKHPFTAPLAIQTPSALIHGGDPHQYLAALEGKGTLAGISKTVAGAASHVAPVLGEAVNLPATVLPSVFLTGKAGVNAAQGSPAELDKLIAEYKKTGLLPALAEGNLGAAGKALSSRPLYSALEASGAASAVGRGAGALARAATHDKVGGLARPDLAVRGTGVNVGRGYSRDLGRQAVQRLRDRRSGNEVAADTFRGRHYLKEAQNRFESGQEAVRKLHAHEDIKSLKDILPRKRGPLGVFGKRLDRKSADVVNLGVERILQHPETFHQDLPLYKQMIEAAAREVGPDGRPRLDKTQLAANKALLTQIDAGIKRANPEHVVQAADAFNALQAPILKEMVDLKLIDPEQAAKASAISFARVHMGAGHQESIGVVDKHGQPLGLAQITAEMKSRGIEPPGFLSHRTPGSGDFYLSNVGGAALPQGPRTGETVAAGSQLGGIEALVRQLRRSRGLVDRAKAWNAAVTRFGIEVPGVKTMKDAQMVLKDPARYGVDPAIQPMVVERFPFQANKVERAGALEHQDPSVAGDVASAILHDSLDQSAKGNLPADSQVVFMPGKVVEGFKAGAQPSGAGMRGVQAATTGFKRAVLPFSPGFYIGNGFDNALRTALAGITPAHFLIGRHVEKHMTPESAAELLAGAHFSSVDALAPHRSVESLVRGYDPLSKGVRAAAEWSRQYGWKQAAAKFGPKMLAGSAHYLLALNAHLTEVLPQRGVLGKIALAEFRSTQGSWVKALTHQGQLAEEFAKGALNPDTMIRFQKSLEEVYGNYTRMSPAARKTLSSIAPFWTWMRAAYKFAYLTMPAHHPIQTGLLTAAARATQSEREKSGLDKQGDRPIADWLQGAVPLSGGSVFPTQNYNSFGYASDPLEAVNRLFLPQYRGAIEALAGRDWKGDELPGGEGGKLLGAVWALGTSFLPGANLFAKETEGRKEFSPHLNLPHSYDKGYVEYQREPKQKITVPASGGGSGSGDFFGSGSSGASSSSTNYFGTFFK